MIDRGIIKETDSLCSAPVVFIKKHDNLRLRDQGI